MTPLLNKPRAHDIQMKNTYADIYNDFYNFEPSVVQRAERIILKNLDDSGISSKQLRSQVVLNVGTGREVYAFHRLGARKIYHFDVSDRSVRALTRLKRSDKFFQNVFSRRTDICRKQQLLNGDKVDFVYLNGVLHHLYDPRQAIANISDVLAPSGKLFFRIYRSGCLAFFLVDFIRRFISIKDREMVKRCFQKKYSHQTAKTKVLWDDLQDDFFVPVLRLYDPQEMHVFFKKCDFKVLGRQRIERNDHGDNSPSAQGFSLIYQRVSLISSAKIKKITFPKPKDQMRDIVYKEKQLKELLCHMTHSLFWIRHLPASKRVDLALDLYKAGQLMHVSGHIRSQEKWSEIKALLVFYEGN